MKLIKETKNEFGIDLLKIMAMFFVISLHYYLYSGYYEYENIQSDIIFHISFRTLFFQCVPLFLMITGYLKRKSTFCAEHFVKATPVIMTYLFISGITIAYKIIFLNENWNNWIWAQSVWTFNQPTYGWYINMYLSLLLFMPLVNAAYNSLKTRKQKRTAVIIGVCATTLAQTINRLPCPEPLDIIGMPLGYFSGMWPFAYYAVGMYIGEFKPKIPKYITAPLAAIGCFLVGFANYQTITTNCYSGFCIDNGDIINVMISTFIFLTFYNLKIENKYIRWIFSKISALSLSTFLISNIFDNIIYNRFAGQFNGYSSYFRLYWKIVPLDFLLSVLASVPVCFICRYISTYIISVYRRISAKSV